MASEPSWRIGSGLEHVCEDRPVIDAQLGQDLAVDVDVLLLFGRCFGKKSLTTILHFTPLDSVLPGSQGRRPPAGLEPADEDIVPESFELLAAFCASEGALGSLSLSLALSLAHSASDRMPCSLELLLTSTLC